MHEQSYRKQVCATKRTRCSHNRITDAFDSVDRRSSVVQLVERRGSSVTLVLVLGPVNVELMQVGCQCTKNTKHQIGYQRARQLKRNVTVVNPAFSRLARTKKTKPNQDGAA